MLNLDLSALLDTSIEIDKEVLREFFKQIQNRLNTIENALGIKQGTLGYTPENVANKKTDLTDNSDTFYASQKAVKTAIDTKQDSLGYTPENVVNKSTATTLGTSDTLYPTQNAVKAYVDGIIAESGTDYIRYKDGTQICWLNVTVSDQAIANAYGSLYQGTRNWTFPKAFSTAPAVQCSHFKWGTSASWGTVSSTGTSTTAATLRGIDIASRAVGTDVYISAIAIGKWI